MPKNETPREDTLGVPDNDNVPFATKEYSTTKVVPMDVDDDFAGSYNPRYLTVEEEARRAELYRAADAYWQLGFRLITIHDVSRGVCSCGEAECAAGKHPVDREWQKASESSADDANWWRVTDPADPSPVNWRPRANIGILTGEPSGIFVVDVDPDNGGDVAWQALCEEHADEPLPSTRIHKTGSGGRHYYFLVPDGVSIRNGVPWGRGIDIRGTGGQVVAPPSFSFKGAYQVMDDAPVAPAPSWVLQAIEDTWKVQRGERPSVPVRVAPNGKRQAYARVVIAANARKVREAPPGERNRTLNEAAFALGQLAPVGILGEEDAWAALSDAASASNLGQAETRRTFLSGWRSGLLKPFSPDWHEDGDFPGRTFDDFGLGDRMVDHYGDVLQWCADRDSWMIWQGGRWENARDAGEILAVAMIDTLPDTEGSCYSDESDDGKTSPAKEFEDQCRKWRTAAAPGRAAQIARWKPAMRMSASDLDVDQLVINLRNGTWNARDAKFYDHRPKDMLSMRGGASYDESAQCPAWDAFLAEVQPDPEMRAYLYRVWGYSLTADTSEQAIFIHHGDGANGKSVAMDALARIMGDYAQTVPVETLLNSKQDGRIPNDVARMAGARLLKASETKQGKQLDEAQVKALTGGETIAARFMRAEFFEFRPTGKIHLTSNHLVHVSADPAIWRRLHLITWPVIIPEDRQDKHLSDRLYEMEAAGILNRLLAGLEDWRASGGLRPPGVAREAKEEYRRDEDSLQHAIDQCFDVDLTRTEHHRDSSLAALWSAYQAYVRQFQPGTGLKSDRALSTALSDKKYEKVKTNIGVCFPQIRARLLTQDRH